MPDLALERGLPGPVAGIDEAGRGPLAGPVVAAAVILPDRGLPDSLMNRLDDSKKLAPALREELFAELTGRVEIGLGAASVGEIDRLNILQATMLAMARALAHLPRRPTTALVDGNRAPVLPCRVQTVVGGDGLSLSIAAASIAAKVTRDRLMRRLARRHPGFGWERNAGYGTTEHRAALVRAGPTKHHRRSFAPISQLYPSNI
ncbi:MAG: ribonuclease HII [Rhodospirillaceae bacterium]|nr:ribonuclease HII [Rhodospirillaceae bacterium]MBT6117296.1 ribonuclease HII [Rhodospirillaceae bacterium]